MTIQLYLRHINILGITIELSPWYHSQIIIEIIIYVVGEGGGDFGGFPLVQFFDNIVSLVLLSTSISRYTCEAGVVV